MSASPHHAHNLQHKFYAILDVIFFGNITVHLTWKAKGSTVFQDRKPFYDEWEHNKKQETAMKYAKSVYKIFNYGNL